eukprot:IDg19204t1
MRHKRRRRNLRLFDSSHALNPSSKINEKAKFHPEHAKEQDKMGTGPVSSGTLTPNYSNLPLSSTENTPFLTESASNNCREEFIAEMEDEVISNPASFQCTALMDYNNVSTHENSFPEQTVDEDDLVTESTHGNSVSQYADSNLHGSTTAPKISTLVQMQGNWKNLWSVIMCSGSRRLTKQSYFSITNVLNSLSHGSDSDLNLSEKNRTQRFPHYNTLQNKLLPSLLQNSTVRPTEIPAKVNMLKAGASTNVLKDLNFPSTTLAIVLPSEYARADIETPVLWNIFKRTSLSEKILIPKINSNPPVLTL